MSADTERKCGTCSHFDSRPTRVNGWCEFPLPFWMRVDHPPCPVSREDGEDCQCWTARAEGEK